MSDWESITFGSVPVLSQVLETFKAAQEAFASSALDVESFAPKGALAEECWHGMATGNAIFDTSSWAELATLDLSTQSASSLSFGLGIAAGPRFEQSRAAKKLRGRPITMSCELKDESLAIKAAGGTHKNTAMKLYGTPYPSPQQKKNASTILRKHREKKAAEAKALHDPPQ